MSITYADSGVDIEAGDSASRLAYKNAKTTFPTRAGLIGQPFEIEGGFAGALDMGDYLLIQNDDGTGSKSEIAEAIGKYDDIGQDLLCMVCDDAICVGAETISLSNTFDVPKVDPNVIDTMTASLARACAAEKIVMPGGEIAEVPGATTRMVWNATAIGVVRKDKFITGASIAEGQVIIGLKDPMLRSNGFSLARKVLENAFGEDWFNCKYAPLGSIHKDSIETDTPQQGVSTWGEALLTPSKIFHRTLLEVVLGDFESPRPFTVHGLAHITGGGVPGNLPRIFPNDTLGAQLDHLHEPSDAVKQLQSIGDLDEAECYRTWHCGTAMMLIVNPEDAETICHKLNLKDPELNAKVVGEVTNTSQIEITSQFSGKKLKF